MLAASSESSRDDVQQLATDIAKDAEVGLDIDAQGVQNADRLTVV